MRLTRQQKGYLRNLKRFREHGASVLALYRAEWPVHLASAVLFFTMTAYMFWTGNGIGFFLLLGMMIGAASTTIGRYATVVRLWPATREIIDWAEVERVLNATDSARGTDQP